MMLVLVFIIIEPDHKSLLKQTKYFTIY